ncbi:MAG: glycosyltransferase [Legionella sp.]
MFQNKPKLFYIIGSLDVGGAEQHLVNVVISLKLLGWQPEIYVLKRGGPLTQVLNQQNIPVHGISLPSWLRFILRPAQLRLVVRLIITFLSLVRTLWLRQPDVVHFFLPDAYLLGGLASLLSRVPIKIMSRRSLNNYQNSNRLLAKLEHWLHSKMTLVCANSQAVMSDLNREGIEPGKLRLIYNGVDTQKYKLCSDTNEAREKVLISEQALVFIIVANLIPYKGHSDLIDAFSMIKNKLNQPWILLCLGRDDGIGAQLKQKIAMNGMANNVRFLGSCTNVADWLALADVGLLSSHQEGFSNALLEGMAASLPMVVTDVGGNSEAVIDGETGYVVPARNPEAFANALLKISFSTQRREMGQKGRQRVEKYFSMHTCIDSYAALYGETFYESKS